MAVVITRETGSRPFHVVSSSVLLSVGAILLGCFFYATGNFGFLNIFDLRREAQAAIIILLLFFVPFVLSRTYAWIKEPLFWLSVVTLLAELLIRAEHSVFFLFDRIATAFVVALLFSLSHTLRIRALKTIIVLAAIFSLMVVIQAVILFFQPSILLSLPKQTKFAIYTTSTQADPVLLNHQIEYLGFTTPGILYVAGHPLTRFRSFTSEPSVVVYIFLVPGLLALTFPGYFRLLSLPILLFAGALASSGTVFLSLALGFISYPVVAFFRRETRIAAILPITLVPVWYLFIAFTDVAVFMTRVSELLAPVEDYYGAFNKTVSGTVRLSIAAGHLRDFGDYLLFGAPFVGAGGFLLHMLLYAGLTGMILAIIISFRILRSSTRAFSRSAGITRLAVALLYGTFVQVMIFSEFGWMSMAGFIMLLLLSERLEGVKKELTAINFYRKLPSGPNFTTIKLQ